MSSSRNVKSGTHVLHDTDGLLSLSDKLVLSLLNLLLGLGAKLLLLRLTSSTLTNLESVTLDASLDSIERQSGVLNVLAGAGRKHDVGVERRVPASKEAALDLGVLGDAGFSNTLHGEGVLLEGSGQRVLTSTSVVLVQGLATSQTGASNGMAEGLGLGLGGRRSDKSCLSLGGGGGGG